MDVQTAGIVVGMITGGISVLGHKLISSRATGKTEGVIQEAVKGLGHRVSAVEDDNKQQWSKIHEHTQDIGYLNGRLNGGAAKAHGHGD